MIVAVRGNCQRLNLRAAPPPAGVAQNALSPDIGVTQARCTGQLEERADSQADLGSGPNFRPQPFGSRKNGVGGSDQNLCSREHVPVRLELESTKQSLFT